MIPKLVHQTWKTRDDAALEPAMRRWVRSWQVTNPGWTHRFSDDADCRAFVARRFPALVETYDGLAPVERADLWRYLTVLDEGGVYSDVDTVCRGPIDDWIRPDDEIVLGVETDHADMYPAWRPTHRVRSGGVFDPSQPWCDNPVLFCNWTFAARPGHALFADVVRRVVINATDPIFTTERTDWVIKKTGPGVLTDAVNDYLRSQGAIPTDVARALRGRRELRVGAIRFLDYEAFHTGYVKHVGLGSWKDLPPLTRLWRQARAAVT